MRTDPPTGDEFTRMLVGMKRDLLEQAAAEEAAASRRTNRNRAVAGGAAILLMLGLGAGAAIASGMLSDDPPAPEPAPAPVATATPTPTWTPSPFPIETAPPVDPLTTVTTITIRPEGLELTDVSGALVRTLSYEGDGASTAAALSTVLAAEPEVTEQGPPDGEPVSVAFDWDGFRLVEYLQPNVHRADTRLGVTSGAPMIGDGVQVTTATGFSAGDDLVAFAAEIGYPHDPLYGAAGPTPIEYGPALGPDREGYRNALAVVSSVTGSEDGSASVIWAPFNFAVEDGTN